MSAKQILTHGIQPPQPAEGLTTRVPWKVIGLSRASFKRLQSAGLAPLPRNFGLDQPRWLISDLIKWAESRPTDRKVRKGPTPKPADQPA